MWFRWGAWRGGFRWYALRGGDEVRPGMWFGPREDDFGARCLYARWEWFSGEDSVAKWRFWNSIALSSGAPSSPLREDHFSLLDPESPNFEVENTSHSLI